MGKVRAILAFYLLAVPALGQIPPVGEFQLRFWPSSKLITVGDSISFTAGYFAMDLRYWGAEYEIRKTSVSPPDSFLVLIRAHVTNKNGPASAGYDGPYLEIFGKEPGIYVIRFDSTSEFQADMGDTAVFTVQPSTAIRSRSFRTGNRGKRDALEPEEKYLLNGGRVYRPTSTPAFTR